MDQTTERAIIQLILHYILFYLNIWSCLNTRATSSAGKTMLFCVVWIIAEKNVVLSSCQCFFKFDFSSVSPKTCAGTCYERVLDDLTLFYFVSCLDILVSNVFRIKPTFSEHLLRVRRWKKSYWNTTPKTELSLSFFYNEVPCSS